MRHIEEFIEIENSLINNNPKALEIVTKIKSNLNKGYFHIYFLHALNIKDKRLEKLYYDCCNQDINILILTLNMFECGTFSVFEILENLNLDTPIPFYNPNITTINALDPKFYNHLDFHKDFCLNQQKNFNEKLMKKLREDHKDYII